MKRILFVDDEPNILEGIERLLRRQRHQWEMAFVDGGEAALVLLASRPFDVIVSDMRMPRMDGAVLLGKVQEQYPQMGRIVLSGHTEIDYALRAARVAHRFLLKPCEGEMLRMAIERTCNLQGIPDSESLARAVGSLGELPAAPRTYAALRRAVSTPEMSIEQVAGILEQDPGLSAKVLQLVNSAFFGLAREITSIAQAVSYLGLNVIHSLVASVEAIRVFDIDPQRSSFSITEFQNHANLTARIVRSFPLARVAADAAVAAGLLHDVGKLALAARLPDKLEQAARVSAERHQSLYEAETELYGVSHAEIGAYLLGLWGLPTLVTEAVAYHHAPLRASHQRLDPVSVVYLSNLLAHELESQPSDKPVAEPVLQELGIHQPYTSLLNRARQAAFAPSGGAIA
jgi:HD-like signal output (HDOD) protein/ActR/RegA family two-component response regulator